MHRNTRIRPPRLLILAWTLICSLLFVSHAVSEEIRVSATVDRNDVTLEDLLQLSVSVHGVQNAPAPALPAMPDFRVQPTGTSVSTQVINGANTSMTTEKMKKVLARRIASI